MTRISHRGVSATSGDRPGFGDAAIVFDRKESNFASIGKADGRRFATRGSYFERQFDGLTNTAKGLIDCGTPRMHLRRFEAVR